MNPLGDRFSVQCHGVSKDWIIHPAAVSFENEMTVLKSIQGDIRLGLDRPSIRKTVESAMKPAYPIPPLGSSVAIARLSQGSASCGIIEITDECDANCATCIAASVPGAGQFRSLDKIVASARAFRSVYPDAPLMLSGGEPALHPKLLAAIEELKIIGGPLYLITNGLRIANDVGFCRALAEANRDLVVYLQYDSTVDAHLEFLRSHEFTSSIRERAINNLESIGLRYFLVCVVAYGVNDNTLGDIVQRNINNPNLRGITFQPIKMLGRNRNASEENTLTRFDVDDELERVLGTRPFDHPENPLNWSTMVLNGGDWCKKEPCGNLYASQLVEKQISVVWHSSAANYVVETCFQRPIVFQDSVKATPLELHYSS